jgi:DNA-binding MarR family transcriptional regulator
MTTIAAAPGGTQAETRETLLAYLDALTLAEPMQLKLWQIAELTLTQVTVLRTLLREGRQSAGRLGHAVGLSPTSVTRLVDRLERRGLVSRHRDSEDRRLVEIQLEPAGEAILSQAKLMKGSAIHRAVESMTDQERRRLTAGLRRLVELARGIAAAEEHRE